MIPLVPLHHINDAVQQKSFSSLCAIFHPLMVLSRVCCAVQRQSNMRAEPCSKPHGILAGVEASSTDLQVGTEVGIDLGEVGYGGHHLRDEHLSVFECVCDSVCAVVVGVEKRRKGARGARGHNKRR